MEATIVIPTYNERGSIKNLINSIDSVFVKNNIDGEIIIIDDNSPDGTGDIIDTIRRRLKYVKVIHRKSKLGVGSARRLGFNSASKKIVVSMEGDSTHNPLYIPELIKEIEDGADLVIGSRYLKDSKIINWSFKRRVISNTANFITRFVTGVKITDVTNGYRAFTKEMFSKLLIESEKYPFNMEFTCEAVSRGFKVTEIPIEFKQRKDGSSKLNVLDEFFFFLMVVFRFSYTYSPIKFFGSISLLFITVSFVLVGYLIRVRLLTGTILNRIPLLFITLTLVLSAIQMFCFGLMVNVMSKFRREMLR